MTRQKFYLTKFFLFFLKIYSWLIEMPIKFLSSKFFNPIVFPNGVQNDHVSHGGGPTAPTYPNGDG